MRLPWQRARPPLDTPAVQRDAGPPPESRAGWAFLPPLRRTVGEPELTSAPMAFVNALPTRVQPMLTGPMSHVVSPAAPAGVIDGDGGRLATPTMRSSQIDLTLVPPTPLTRPAVQRRAAGGLTSLAVPPPDLPALAAVALPAPADAGSAEPAADAGGEGPTTADATAERPTTVDVGVPRPLVVDVGGAGPTVAGAGVEGPTFVDLPVASVPVGAPMSASVQRSTNPFVPATPPADPLSPQGGATQPAPAGPRAQVQRRVGLGAPLRAAVLPTVDRARSAVPTARELPGPDVAEPTVAAPSGALPSEPDLALVQRSADPPDTADSESSPPTDAETPAEPPEPLLTPDLPPTTGTLVGVVTTLTGADEPRPSGDRPATSISPPPAPPVVARAISDRARGSGADEPTTPTTDVVERSTSPTTPPLVQRAPSDVAPGSGTVPIIGPPVQRASRPDSGTVPTTAAPVQRASTVPTTGAPVQRASVPDTGTVPTIAAPVRHMSGPSSRADDDGPAPLLQRAGAPAPSSVGGTLSTTGVRADTPVPTGPQGAEPSPVVAARTVAAPRADAAPGLSEAQRVGAAPLLADPIPTTSGSPGPAAPVVQRAPLLSGARAPMLASSPRSPATLIPRPGRPTTVVPTPPTAISDASAPTHALVAPDLPPLTVLPGLDGYPAATSRPSPVPAPSLPVQRLDAVADVLPHPAQRTTARTPGPDAGTDTEPDVATVQTLVDLPTVQPAGPPEQASAPDSDGAPTSPFAAASAADLDDLARRLTAPLLRRVRGQLLVDRERRGVRVDL